MNSKEQSKVKGLQTRMKLVRTEEQREKMKARVLGGWRTNRDIKEKVKTEKED